MTGCRKNRGEEEKVKGEEEEEEEKKEKPQSKLKELAVCMPRTSSR